MPRRTPTPESSQSIPDMVDELTRQEIATWNKDGKLTPHGRQMAKLPCRALSAAFLLTVLLAGCSTPPRG